MADAAATVEVALHVHDVLDVLWWLLHRLDARLHVEAGPESGVDPFAEIEVQVPGLEILEQMRHMHARPLPEVRAWTEVDVAERLEIDDMARAECVLLRGREAEKQLGRLGDEIRSGNPSRGRALPRPAAPPTAAAADASFPDARQLEHAHLVPQR